MYNLIEYSENYSKTGSLPHYYTDNPNVTLTDSESLHDGITRQNN